MTLTMIYKIQKHMDPEELEKYSMGDLPDAEAARIEEHLLVCEVCRQRVAGTDEFVASMSRAAGVVRQKQIDPRWRFAAILAAAACFLVVVAVALRGPVTRQPEAAVSLMAMRANGIGATAPAGRLMRLQPDLTGLDQGKPYRLDVVNQNGGRSGRADWFLLRIVFGLRLRLVACTLFASLRPVASCCASTGSK